MLLLVVKLKVTEGIVNDVAKVVRSIFERSGILSAAESVSFRAFMLFAYADAHLIIDNLVAPRPIKKDRDNVLAWLNGPGAKVKACLEEGFKFETLEKPESLRKSYESACRE